MTAGTCLDDGVSRDRSVRGLFRSLFSIPATYVAGGYTGTNGVAQVMNLLGFFVEGMCNDVYPDARPVWSDRGTPPTQQEGRWPTDELSRPGIRLCGSAGPATFLKITRLIQ